MSTVPLLQMGKITYLVQPDVHLLFIQFSGIHVALTGTVPNFVLLTMHPSCYDWYF